MKKLLSALLALALMCALLAPPVLAEEAETITITDHAGNEVTLPKKINRIVTASIYPFASVVTMYLGSAEKLVGIHPVSYSAAVNSTLGRLFPEIANASTDFMTGSDLNIEELIKLEPDVVFYNAGTAQVKELCDQAGIPAVAVSATKWDYDVIKTYDEWIALLSQIFPEQDKAQVVSDYSKEIYDMIQERVSSLDDSERTRVLFLFQYSDSAMITAGCRFFGQYWATAGGGINVAQDLEAENAHATISMEQVYEWNPDVIYITNFTPTQPEDIYNNAIGGDDWSTVKAVQDGRVHKLPLGSYRTYTPGTDTPMTLLWMAKTMYPDLFADIDLEQQVRDYYQEIYGVALSDEDVSAMFTPSSAAAEGFKK